MDRGINEFHVLAEVCSTLENKEKYGPYPLESCACGGHHPG